MNLVYKARVLLINIGKMLPFVLCGVIVISYTETIIALVSQDFVEWNGYVITNNKISWIIGTYFEYDFVTLVALVVLSISVQTCIYNKLACGYLGINLWEKSYLTFELEPTTIYLICLANILVAGYLTIKGLSILTRKQL